MFLENKTRYDAANHSHTLGATSCGLTTLNNPGGNDVAIIHENVYRMV
jgi:hypothetical protein